MGEQVLRNRDALSHLPCGSKDEKSSKESAMSIASLGQTLASFSANKISGESLANPLSKTVDKILNVLTLGIYGAYKESAALGMANDLLDFAKAVALWKPDSPEIPVRLNISGRSYEIYDVPNGGIQVFDCASGEKEDIEGVSLALMRDMIFSDLMSYPDFSEIMARRIDEDTTVCVDFVGLKQERANACGEASRNMLLAYHGIDYAPATNTRSILEGTTNEEVISELREQGLLPEALWKEFPEKYTCKEIEQGLKNGPLLCNLEGHLIVVHGVNDIFDRVDVFCPLLGNRCVSLADFNSHLEWAQDDGFAPLTQFKKSAESVENVSAGFGERVETGSSPDLIDRLGVSVLKAGYALGNSWLKTPEEFARSLESR